MTRSPSYWLFSGIPYPVGTHFTPMQFSQSSLCWTFDVAALMKWEEVLESLVPAPLFLRISLRFLNSWIAGASMASSFSKFDIRGNSELLYLNTLPNVLHSCSYMTRRNVSFIFHLSSIPFSSSFLSASISRGWFSKLPHLHITSPRSYRTLLKRFSSAQFIFVVPFTRSSLSLSWFRVTRRVYLGDSSQYISIAVANHSQATTTGDRRCPAHLRVSLSFFCENSSWTC